MQDPYINPVTNPDELLRLIIDLQKQDTKRIIAEHRMDEFYRERSKVNLN